MPQQFIDTLELVDIDQMKRKGAITATCAGNLATQAVLEIIAIGKTGDGIMLKGMQQMFVGALSIGDIQRAGDNPQDRLVGVAQRALGGEEHTFLASHISQLPLETGQGLTAANNLTVQQAVRSHKIRVDKNITAFAHEVSRITPQKAAYELIGKHDTAIKIAGTDHGGNRINDLRKTLT